MLRGAMRMEGIACAGRAATSGMLCGLAAKVKGRPEGGGSRVALEAAPAPKASSE